MSRNPDLIGREFGRLIVRAFAGSWRDTPDGESRRHWVADCSCGGTLIASTSELTSGNRWHCADCQPEQKGADYLRDYKFYRDHFTPQQRELYEEVLNGRRGWMIEAEAVDLVMRNMNIPRTRDAA